MKDTSRQTQSLEHPLLSFIVVALLAVVVMNGAALLAQAAWGADAPSSGGGMGVAGEDASSLMGDIAGAIAMLVALGIFFPWEFGRKGRGRKGREAASAVTGGRAHAGKSKLVVPSVLVGVAMVAAGGISAALTLASIHAPSAPIAGGQTLVVASDVPFVVVSLVVMCIATALFEEGLFRGMAIPCFARSFQKGIFHDSRLKGSSLKGETAANTTPLSFQALLKAAILSSVLFGLLHCGLDEASAVAAGQVADTSSGGEATVLVAWVCGRFLQTALFGLAMAAVFLITQTIWPVVVFHALYDFVYFAPVVLSTGTSLQDFMVFPFLSGETLALTGIIFGVIAIALFAVLRKRLFAGSMNATAEEREEGYQG